MYCLTDEMICEFMQASKLLEFWKAMMGYALLERTKDKLCSSLSSKQVANL